MEIQCFAVWAQDFRRPALSYMSPYSAGTVRHHPSVLVPLVTLQYDRLAHKNNIFIAAFTGFATTLPGILPVSWNIREKRDAEKSLCVVVLMLLGGGGVTNIFPTLFP